MDFTLLFVDLALVLFVLAGIMLTLVGLPGNWLILLSAAAYGFYEGFTYFDYRFLGLLTGAVLLGETVEFLAGVAGAKRERASRRAMAAAVFGGIIGAILGSLLLPLAGSLLGGVAGAFCACYLAEYSKTRNSDKAGRVARSAAIGLLLGTLFKLTIGVGIVIAILTRLPWGL